MSKIDYDMGMVVGVVKYIGFKPLASPDRYGNTHRVSLLVDGVEHDGKGIFFLSTVKDRGYGVQLPAKHDGRWSNVEKGDTVKFQFTQSGDFFNLKGSIEIKTKGAGGNQPVATNSQSQAQANTVTGSVNPAEVGQAINLAALSLGYKSADMLCEEKVLEAIAWYKDVKKLFTESWDKKPVIEQNNTQFDDDIPF